MKKKPELVTPDFDLFEEAVTEVVEYNNAEPDQDAWNRQATSKKKNIRINFMVNQETEIQLKEMAKFHGLSVSAYLNELIKRDYDMCKK